MNFANVITLEFRDSLPKTLTKDGSVIQNATLEHYQSLGWRRVVNVAQPTAGFRVVSYDIVETTPTTCDLTIGTQVNLADEESASVAMQLAFTKDGAKSLAELSTDPVGRVIQAFMELTLQEINTLRTRAGLVAYTKSQFVNALKAKIDAQT